MESNWQGFLRCSLGREDAVSASLRLFIARCFCQMVVPSLHAERPPTSAAPPQRATINRSPIDPSVLKSWPAVAAGDVRTTLRATYAATSVASFHKHASRRSCTLSKPITMSFRALARNLVSKSRVGRTCCKISTQEGMNPCGRSDRAALTDFCNNRQGACNQAHNPWQEIN